MINMPVGLKGRYKLQVKKAGKILRESGWSDNLITDLGLNLIASSYSTFMRYCHVGDGNTAPANSDTALAGFVAGADGNSGVDASLDTTNRYAIVSKTYTFSNGAAAGNIAEVGVGSAASGTVLFSRALVLDTQKNPTTITVQSDEDLVVIYELWIKQPTGDFTDTVGGKNITIRACNVDSTASNNSWGAVSIDAAGMYPGALAYAYDGVIGAITGMPSGTSGSTSLKVVDDYVADSHERTCTFTFGVSSANFAIKSFLWKFGISAWQMEIDTTITKNNTQTFKLGVRISWSRDNGPS